MDGDGTAKEEATLIQLIMHKHGKITDILPEQEGKSPPARTLAI